MITALVWIAAAYLAGSIPFGFLAGKIRGIDLRKEGSGNIGATNAARVLGKPWGIGVFLLDFSKGLIPALLSRVTNQPEFIQVLVALFAILGHNFPIWLGFRGGKGIATSAGTIIALYPWQVFAAALIAWALLFWTTRYVSVASIGAAFIFPIASSILFYLDQCGGILTTLAFLLSILAIWKHRSNIIRLRNGTEPKFSKKPKISSLPS